jgi:DNA-binding NarL/FixJ family response regulator
VTKHGRLTPQEQRVLEVLCIAGETNAEIGARLHVTPATVKWHLSHAMSTSGRTNRTAIALWWLRVGRWSYLNNVDPDSG